MAESVQISAMKDWVADDGVAPCPSHRSISQVPSIKIKEWVPFLKTITGIIYPKRSVELARAKTLSDR